MPEGWTFAPRCWNDSSLVMPTFGRYANTVMAAESELAKCLGFNLSSVKVLGLLLEAINNGMLYESFDSLRTRDFSM